MKNIFKYISFIIILILIVNISFAGDNSCKVQVNPNDCKIKDPPKYLTKFMKNLKKIENNVKSAAKAEGYDGSAYDSDYDYKGYLNSVFDWSNYDVTHEYHTEESRDNEVPKEVKRDSKKLKKLKEKIKLIDGPKGQYEVSYKDICKGLSEEECGFPKNAHLYANNVLKRIKKSAQQVNNIIQNKATEVNIPREKPKIYGIKDDDIKKLKKDYSEKNLKKCLVATKQGLYKNLNSIKKSGCNSKDSKKATDKWTESQLKQSPQWKIKKEWKKAKKEDDKISKKLEKKNILGGDPEFKSKNNKDYDKNKQEKTYLDQRMDDDRRFLDTLKKLIPEAFTEGESNSDKELGNKKVLTAAMKTMRKEQSNLSEVKSASYKPNKEYARQGNTQGDNGKGHLSDITKNLSQAINKHTKTKPMANEVCNKQESDLGCGN